jgi:hypothetical protein
MPSQPSLQACSCTTGPGSSKTRFRTSASGWHFAQEARQLGLAHLDRLVAEIAAVELQEIERTVNGHNLSAPGRDFAAGLDRVRIKIRGGRWIRATAPVMATAGERKGQMPLPLPHRVLIFAPLLQRPIRPGSHAARNAALASSRLSATPPFGCSAKKEPRRGFAREGSRRGSMPARLEARAAMAGSDAVMAYLSQPVEKHTLLPLRARRAERRLGLVEAVGHPAVRAVAHQGLCSLGLCARGGALSRFCPGSALVVRDPAPPDDGYSLLLLRYFFATFPRNHKG